jgi:hypothetical protein
MGIFTAESLALLARRQRPRKTDAIASIDSQAKERLPSKQPPPLGDPDDDSIDPDDSGPRLVVALKTDAVGAGRGARSQSRYGDSHITRCSDSEQNVTRLESGRRSDSEQTVGEIYALLPPPSPNWSHILGSRPNEPVSALSAHRALLAVACRLSLRPSPNAIREASRCRSAGAVRSLLVRVYGERGLAIAYQLAGREQPDKIVSRVNGVTRGDTATGVPDLLETAVLRSMSPRVAAFMLYTPRDPPRWRTSPPPDGADDGSWCG